MPRKRRKMNLSDMTEMTHVRPLVRSQKLWKNGDWKITEIVVLLHETLITNGNFIIVSPIV